MWLQQPKYMCVFWYKCMKESVWMTVTYCINIGRMCVLLQGNRVECISVELDATTCISFQMGICLCESSWSCWVEIVTFTNFYTLSSCCCSLPTTPLSTLSLCALFFNSLSSFFHRRSAVCPVELLLVCVSGACTPWRASYVSWRPAARPQCSAGFPAWSCRTAMLSKRPVFAFSGPIKLSEDVQAPVRHYTHSQEFGKGGSYRIVQIILL